MSVYFPHYHYLPLPFSQARELEEVINYTQLLSGFL